MRNVSGKFLGVVLAVLCAEAFALSGTVKDGGGTAIAGATVILVSDTSIHQMTDTNGAFSLNVSSAIFSPGNFGTAGQGIDHLIIRDGQIRFSLPAPILEASVRLFSSNGIKQFATSPESWNAGTHALNLPHLAPGLYYLRLTLDGQTSVSPIVLSGRSTVMRSASSERSTAPVLGRRAVQAADAIDTVLVKKHGYLTTKSPITSYTQTGLEITLQPDTVSPLPAITDYSANGPYATVVEANVGPGNAYTIFRPETLGANGFKHAPIIYGHGIGAQVSGFTAFLRNVASHGFVIIACNILNGGPNAAANTNAMMNGLDWILAQDTTTGSIYNDKLATDRAASMGYSVGGTAAVDIGAHPALATVVSIHGHISNATLHGTLLQTSGTLDNVGLPMQQETFDSSDVQTFLGTVTGANHGYIQNNTGGVQRPAIVAWLRYWIYNDHGAKHYFYGNDCVMCAAPWENPQRKNWN